MGKFRGLLHELAARIGPRAIAEDEIKTDKVDSRVLADLLRCEFSMGYRARIRRE